MKKTLQITKRCKHWLCLSLLALIAAPSNAQTYAIVGNGTTYNTTTSYPAPYGNYWYGARHQMFVQASELTGAGILPNSLILSLGFDVYSTNGTTHQGWTVKVYTTTAANPISAAYISTGLVSTATVTNYLPVTGWNQHAVSPFTWNGTDNLVVEVCFNNGAYTTNAQTYYTTNLSGATFSRWNNADAQGQCVAVGNNSSTNTRPNIRFGIGPFCTGQPPANSINSPNFELCPNTSYNFSTLSSYTLSGLAYQWMSSTVSAIGPFTPVAPGGTTSAFTTPSLNASTWYQLEVYCPTQGTMVSNIATITIAAPTVSNVPYFEGFEGIGLNDRLPNCEWTATNLQTSTKTYTQSYANNRIPKNGNSYAAFSNVTPGTNYYYTNGINMVPGITYSASLWFQTDLSGSANWSNLSISVGSAQATAGQSLIATTGPGAISPTYKAVANTFTVATAGVYYVQVEATSAAGGAPYLVWDDLRIEIPCTPTMNTPTVTAVASSTSVCQGQTITITAGGAHVYSWGSGSTNTVITDVPLGASQYMVIGTNTLTGCSSTAAVNVSVKLAPSVNAIALDPDVCQGQSTSLMASGAASYAWNTNNTGAVISVTPSSSMSYTVIGTATNNCTGSSAVTVSVLPLPTVLASANVNVICAKESVILTGAGAVNYQWLSSNGQLFQLNPLNQVLTLPTSYTVTGTDANGCSATNVVAITVNECTGIAERSGAAAVRIYPNPATDVLNIASDLQISNVTITDISGRVVFSSAVNDVNTSVNISAFAKGVYYVTISGDAHTSVQKFIHE